MLRIALPIATVLGAILLPSIASRAAQLDELKSLDLQLPYSNQMFPGGPGSDAMDRDCLICHSADHVLNQPVLPRKVWAEVVQKMITAYKAPVASADVAPIVDYLAHMHM